LKEHLVDVFIEEAMINASLDTEKSTFRKYILLSQNTGYGDDEATHLVKELYFKPRLLLETSCTLRRKETKLESRSQSSYWTSGKRLMIFVG
jgi:hypothetical protein